MNPNFHYGCGDSVEAGGADMRCRRFLPGYLSGTEDELRSALGKLE